MPVTGNFTQAKLRIAPYFRIFEKIYKRKKIVFKKDCLGCL